MSPVERMVLAVAALATAIGAHAQMAAAASALPAILRGSAPAASAPAAKPVGPADPARTPAATLAAPHPAAPATAAPPHPVELAPAHGAPEAKPQANAIAADATIGTITELSRQLKVQQLRKELREAGKDQGVTGAAPAAPETAAAPAAPRRGAAATPAPLYAPPIAGIVGAGGKRRLRLATGGEMTEGQSISSAVAQATVLSIGPAAVTFRVCERAVPSAAAQGKRHAAPAQPRCENKTVAPSGL